MINKISILNAPPPFQAWLSISNDPDHATENTQREIHKLIWQELDLPFSDSLFIESYNKNLPDQLNLRDHPNYFKMHKFDTIHNWGDYMNSISKVFNRDNVIESIKLLQKYSIAPTIWTDHAKNPGNILHNRFVDLEPYTFDSSGYKYTNSQYTLDLAHEIGIRYIWDGKLTSFIGQNVKTGRFSWYKHKVSSTYKALILCIMDITKKLLAPSKKFWILDYDGDVNNILKKITFPGDLKFYTFKRYGYWKYADIDGLANVLTNFYFDSLCKKKGVSIIYTHLGKKNINNLNETNHINSDTKKALESLKKYYDEGKIYLSEMDKLLDYHVIKNNIQIAKNMLTFKSDGIRFKKISKDEINSCKIGVKLSNPNKLKIFVDEKPSKFSLKKMTGSEYIICLR